MTGQGVDLDAVEARRDEAVYKADQTTRIGWPERQQALGASSNDVPALVARIRDLEAQVAALTTLHTYAPHCDLPYGTCSACKQPFSHSVHTNVRHAEEVKP